MSLLEAVGMFVICVACCVGLFFLPFLLLLATPWMIFKSFQKEVWYKDIRDVRAERGDPWGIKPFSEPEIQAMLEEMKEPQRERRK